MKDNLDIEKLFKDKFENFEGDVNPNLWNNIAQGVATNATVGTGMGLGIKALIVSASVVAVGVTTYYVGGFNTNTPTIAENQINPNNEVLVPVIENGTIENKTVIIAEDNDPVITENEDEIIQSLSNQTVVYNPETENVEIEGPVSHTSVSNGGQITSSNETTVNNNSSDHNNDVSSNQTEPVDENVETEEKPNIVFPKGNLSFAVNDNMYSYDFSSNAKNHNKVEWNFGDGQFSTEINPNHIYARPGEYKVTLTITSKDNEIYEELKSIEIKTSSSIDNIPNVITPNGDRINDQFVIQSTDIETFSIVINDQFGNKIFESSDQNFSWDGIDMGGNPVEKAMYIYYIFATGYDGTVLKIPGQVYVR